MKTKTLLAGLGLCLLAACSISKEELIVDKELDYCNRQVHRTLDIMRGKGGKIDYTMMPRNILDGQYDWNYRKATKDEWCSGFWPGILWYDYEYTGDEKIKEEAEKFTASLKFLSEIPAFDHDLGFLVFCSYGNGYRLTHNPEYKQVILNTADSLATLFSPRVGTILSWPRNVEMFGGHNTIMDNLINLEMLFWAAKNGGNPYLADIAVSHADKTMKYQFRPDYTSCHVAVYDTLTGDFIRGCTHQGYADNSMWARGQAWGIYGYTTVYRETKDVRYLDFVQKVTDVYLKNLPEDYVPYWDFNDPAIPDAPRDASAAAVVASALLELSTYLPGEKGREYKGAAIKMLKSLSSDKYQSRKSKPSFLLHSTGHWPAKSEIDASIIYADYYYMEALLRLKKLDEKRTGSLLHDLVLYAFRFQNYNKMQEPFDINKEVSDTIRRLARKGPCIFIGRCADFALDGECDVLKLFIYASSMEKRKRRICEVDDIAFEKAEEEIQKRDSQRSDYYHYFTGKNWGDMENYDACLNTSVLGYEGCADLIMKMME